LKSQYVARLIYVKKDNLLISGSVDGRISIWNLYYFQCVQNFSALGGGVRSLVLLPGGFFLLDYMMTVLKSGILKIVNV
jgi:WD40 repeat protein